MSHHDQLLRFSFHHLDIRGELVYLDNSWQQVLARYNYTPTVQVQLGYALAALALLSATIKFDGNLILQVQGNGPLKRLVAQVTSDGEIRALARWEGSVPDGSLQQVFGEGRIVISVMSSGAEPYQSIVALEGHNLADALNVYFLQSEQLPSTFKLVATGERVAGLFLQQMPSRRTTHAQQLALEDREEDWNRINLLAATMATDELLNLPPETLLLRLFHEEEVMLHAPKRLRFSCTCSREKIERTLITLGRAELDDALRSEGKLEADCEFCHQRYQFSAADIAALFTPNSDQVPPGTVMH